jgi:formylglycine-generating enzyme required for sulfatase activity
MKPEFRYPYEPKDSRREDLKAGDDVLRVLRGGSWDLNQDFARCTFRFRYHPNYRLDYIGFRVVVSPISAL